jgi:hypothetical protein
LTILKFPDVRARAWPIGPVGFLLRLRDLVDRGKLEISQLRLNDVLGWLLRLGRERDAPLGELCGVLESAARLLVVKSRRLTGFSDEVAAEDLTPWAGPPPELPLRRSWLGERIARGPLSFVGPVRSYDAAPPSLMPVSPTVLEEAMLAALRRARRPVPVLAPRIVRMPVERASEIILDELDRRGEIRLHEVAGRNRDAQVAAFLACLTLARQGRIALGQDELFGQISIWPAAAESEALA